MCWGWVQGKHFTHGASSILASALNTLNVGIYVPSLKSSLYSDGDGGGGDSSGGGDGSRGANACGDVQKLRWRVSSDPLLLP